MAVSYQRLLEALGTALAEYYTIDELLDSFIDAPSAPTIREKRRQQRSNREIERITALYRRARG